MDDELAWMDAVGQAELVRHNQASPIELVDAAIARIEATDGVLNAVIHRRFERAREEAARDLPDGPLRGVPFLIKDLYAPMAGEPLHNGTRVLRDAGYVAPEDSWLNGRYRQAGLVVVGRTNTPEFGLVPTTEPVSHGATHNPWDVAYSPGGSSGGSAAAVAAGMVPAAHASDGGGSIRIPASACGLVGLKVSRGRMTLGPDRDESGLSVNHVVTRSVRDSAAFLDATHGPGPGDLAIAPAPTRPFASEVGSDPGQLRIGMLETVPGGRLHPDCAAAVHHAAGLLEGLGHHVAGEYPTILAHLPELAGTFAARWCVNARMAIGGLEALAGRPVTEADVEPATWMMATAGDHYSGPDLARALAAAARLTRELGMWWAGGWDLLLTPTLGQPPPRLATLDSVAGDHGDATVRTTELVPFTTHFNVSGQPAINLPLYWNEAGLPIGIQLVAAYGREDVLLRVASQLEAAHPWAGRRPPPARPA